MQLLLIVNFVTDKGVNYAFYYPIHNKMYGDILRHLFYALIFMRSFDSRRFKHE